MGQAFDIAKKWADETRDKILTESSSRTIGLLTAIIANTPLDTGLAAGNWRTSTSEQALPIQRFGKDAAISEVKSVLHKGYFAKNKAVYFTNNLAYAHGLEFGNPTYTNPAAPFSMQAPAGMVRVNIKNYLV